MTRLDVVGLGSLNIDYIVTAEEIPKAPRRELLSRFERGQEIGIDDHEQFLSTLALAQSRSSSLVEAYGGSAFNFVRALRQLDPSLKIGLAGTLGRVESERLPPHGEYFDDLRVDAGGVVAHDGPVAKCLSVVEENTRSLMTYYDDGFLDTLASERKRLVKYLCQARIVHVTSFLGPAGPSGVLELIRAVEEKNGSVCFSVDPGAVWASTAMNDGAVTEILRRAQYAFVNLPELRMLGRTDDPAVAATRVLADSSDDASVVVLKEWNRAVRFQWDRRSGRAVGQAVEQSVLPIPCIVDSTGAGDVFAAGVIAGEVSKPVRRSLALRLGLAAGRHRLQHLGDAAYDRLGEVVAGQWVEDSGTDVFISHAAADSSTTTAVVELLERGAGVPTRRLFYTSLDTTGVGAGDPVADEIREHLISARVMLALVTPTYLRSWFCRYEYGGAWALRKTIYPLRLPSVAPRELTELQRSIQVPLLTDRSALSELYDFLAAHRIATTEPATWHRHADAFLRAINI
jgi:sugar/nucleoside kinase (ribokinase family)